MIFIAAAVAPLGTACAGDDLVLTNALNPAEVEYIYQGQETESTPDLMAEYEALRNRTPPDGWVAPDDLWQRVRNGFAMRELDSPLVARYEQWYGHRPEYITRMAERANRYLYFIVDEVEKRGMPTEIALLPMIESAFNPSAYSIANASGIWQFIPSTGRNYGMQQNWWYDGRRDIVSATRGALDYLQKLHDQFGDWELALAAYNWGEGAVQRAQERNMKRGLPIDYASLTMPDETRNYVPKLLAIKNLVARPWQRNLQIPSIPNEPYFAEVLTTDHMDVKVAAQLADISMEEFNALNPAHSRPVMLQNNSPTILLPIDKVATFYKNLEHFNQPLVNWQAYQSKKGERLDKLAPRFGLTVEKLKSINGLSAKAQTSSGQTLLVPSRSNDDVEHEFEAFNMHLAPTTPDLARNIRSRLVAAKAASARGKGKAATQARGHHERVARAERSKSHGKRSRVVRSEPRLKNAKVASLSRTQSARTPARAKAQPPKRMHVASNP